GVPIALGNPAGYTWNVDQSQHVVFRGTDNHIYELWMTLSGRWAWNDLTAKSGAPLTVGDPMGYSWGNAQHVVYRSGDGHIYEMWFNGIWNFTDLTRAAGADSIRLR